MSFRRLALLLCLPLAVLISSQWASLGGDSPSDSYLVSSWEAAAPLNELDENASLDVGAPDAIPEIALNRYFDWISTDLGYVPNATLDLRTTGPPIA